MKKPRKMTWKVLLQLQRKAIKSLREVFCRHVGDPNRGLDIKTLVQWGPHLLKGQGPSNELVWKIGSISMFEKESESMYLKFNLCSGGVGGFAKNSAKGSRLHCSNVRLWHPWLLARVKWHLFFTIKCLNIQTNRLLKSEDEVVIAFGTWSTTLRQQDEFHWRRRSVAARWLDWGEEWRIWGLHLSSRRKWT